MNTNDMTNEQLRERIQLLERLRELETGTVQVKVTKQPSRDPSKWYPDNRNWVEHSPVNPVDRSKVVDFMFRWEREAQRQAFADPTNDYTVSLWDAEFNWGCGRTDIVAVVLKD